MTADDRDLAAPTPEVMHAALNAWKRWRTEGPTGSTPLSVAVAAAEAQVRERIAADIETAPNKATYGSPWIEGAYVRCARIARGGAS